MEDEDAAPAGVAGAAAGTPWPSVRRRGCCLARRPPRACWGPGSRATGVARRSPEGLKGCALGLKRDTTDGSSLFGADVGRLPAGPERDPGRDVGCPRAAAGADVGGTVGAGVVVTADPATGGAGPAGAAVPRPPARRGWRGGGRAAEELWGAAGAGAGEGGAGCQLCTMRSATSWLTRTNGGAPAPGGPEGGGAGAAACMARVRWRNVRSSTIPSCS
jgi:hypothetical protein